MPPQVQVGLRREDLEPLLDQHQRFDAERGEHRLGGGYVDHPVHDAQSVEDGSGSRSLHQVAHFEPACLQMRDDAVEGVAVAGAAPAEIRVGFDDHGLGREPGAQLAEDLGRMRFIDR